MDDFVAWLFVRWYKVFLVERSWTHVRSHDLTCLSARLVLVSGLLTTYLSVALAYT